MKLTATRRAEKTKGANKRIRRSGNIPAIFYSSKEPGTPIEIDGAQFQEAMRKIKSGHLSTTIFSLELEGKTHKAIVKGIEYDVTSYNIIHLDFAALVDDIPVSVKVPLECVGVADCVGIKLGGAMRQIIRSVNVKCLPKDIPSEFTLDIRQLGMKQSKRLSDIEMPAGVKPVAATDEVVVVIAKR